MVGTCSLLVRDEECIRNYGQKTLTKRSHERLSDKCKDNTEMYDLHQLTLDRIQ